MNLGSPYFLLLAIGFAVGCFWFVRRGEKLGIARIALIDVCIFAIVGGLVGSRILHIVAEPLPDYSLNPHELEDLRADLAKLDPEGRALIEAALTREPVPAVWSFVARMPAGAARDEAIALARRDPGAVPAWLWYRARPLEMVLFWKGGLAYMGGLALAIALCLAAARRHGAPLRDILDVASPAIILGLVFGRIGCFLGGCCYGEVCEPGWWATPPSWYGLPAGQVPRYPTALLSAGFALLLFFVLRALLARRKAPGEVFLAMLVLYAPGRFLIEALRADPRGGGLGLSTSQIGVLVTGLPALAAWVWLRVKAPTAEADAEEPASAGA